MCPSSKFAYKFALVDFAAVAEHTERVGLGNVLADDILLAAGKLEHLRLYFREILGSDLMLTGIYIVIESVFRWQDRFRTSHRGKVPEGPLREGAPTSARTHVSLRGHPI